jgi:hypothetical protein
MHIKNKGFALFLPLLASCASVSPPPPQHPHFFCTKEEICIRYVEINSSDFCFGGNFNATYKTTNSIEILASEYIKNSGCRLHLNSLILPNSTGDFVDIRKEDFK